APASTGECFERFVPTNNPTRIVLDHDTNIDRFDNVLAEVLQALVFTGLLLERAIQTRIFDRDSDIIGHRLQQLQILARQVVDVLSPSKREISDHTILDPARNKVVQIMQLRFKEEIWPLGRGFQE